MSARDTVVLDPARANALLAALGRDGHVVNGNPLLPFFHQIYFWDAQPPDRLGRDGHPQKGTGLVPDLGLPRRMWAGGQLTFSAPLRAGVETTKVSTVENTQHKTGRSGPLAFVTLKHEIWQGDALCVTEHQDLVYRNDPDPNAPKPAVRDAPVEADQRMHATFDTTLLFRYSALTFNGHRIHYDVDYAREVEGYSGLVVHGPLLAQMLMLMAHDTLGDLTQFVFRAVSPLMHHETATLLRKGRDLWVAGPDGRMVMQAHA